MEQIYPSRGQLQMEEPREQRVLLTGFQVPMIKDICTTGDRIPLSVSSADFPQSLQISASQIFPLPLVFKQVKPGPKPKQHVVYETLLVDHLAVIEAVGRMPQQPLQQLPPPPLPSQLMLPPPPLGLPLEAVPAAGGCSPCTLYPLVLHLGSHQGLMPAAVPPLPNAASRQPPAPKS